MRRSMLFVPAQKPGNLINADVYGADSLILDLEDAIAPDQKDAARILCKHAMRTFDWDAEIIIRINSLGTPYWQEDLDMIIPEGPDVIMPTKIYSAEDIKTIDDYITGIEKANGMEVGKVKLLPLIETAASVENAYSIALASPRMIGLYLGAGDLSLDMKATRTPEAIEMLYAREKLVMAARAAGIDALDTPFVSNIYDYDGLRAECIMNKNMGFNGKACIYPRQVEIVNEVFAPTEKEYKWALDIIEGYNKARAEGKGVVSVHGELVDGPIPIIAQSIIDEYERIHGKSI